MADDEQEAGAPKATTPGAFKYPHPRQEESIVVAADSTQPYRAKTHSMNLLDTAIRRNWKAIRKSLPTESFRLARGVGDVEERVHERDFAERMRATRLAQSRRDPDWAAQWLAIEDEYEERCEPRGAGAHGR